MPNDALGRLLPDLAARAASAVAELAATAGSVDEFRPAAVDAVRDAGLHLLTLPADRGGLGGRLADSVRVLAAIGAQDASVALGLAMQTHVLGSAVETGAWPAPPFDRLATAARDERALVNAASTEEGSGSPSRGGLPDTRAVRDGDGWLVSGEKTFTTWLPALRFALVSARLLEGPNAAGDDAANDAVLAASDIVVGNLLVDLETSGVDRILDFEALGMRGSASGRLVLRDVRVPADMLVVRRGARERDPRGASPQAWFAACLAGVYLGVGEGARAAVTRWAVDWRPGDGSTAVAEIPSVQVRLGRLDAALRAARLVLEAVAERWDAAASETRSDLLADILLAKIVATNAAVEATDEALRIAGGPGFVVGPLERAFRDARAGLINPPLDDVAYQGFARTLVERARTP